MPASRLEEGLVPGLTLTEHFVLAEKTQGVFIDRDKGVKLAEERIESFNIRGTPVSTVESLSGGNQQRALLALLANAAFVDPFGASNTWPGYRIDHLHLEQAQGTLQTGVGDHFYIL